MSYRHGHECITGRVHQERIMSITLKRITFFVEDLPAATSYYSDALGMTGADIRNGWSAYKVAGKFEIAFHRGKGRKPRLEFTTSEDLATVRDRMKLAGAKMGPVTEVSESVYKIRGKDPQNNMIEIFSKR